MAMLYTLISERDAAGSVHHHLVGCGFDEPWITRFGFYDFEAPDVVLGKVGIRPQDIETVFVSHMHFDHINNLHRFPNARVVVQWDEYEGWSRVLSLPKLFLPLGRRAGSRRRSTVATWRCSAAWPASTAWATSATATSCPWASSGT